MGYAAYTFADYSGEKSNCSFDFGPINAGTHDAIVALIGALTTALGGVTLGNINKEAIFLSDQVIDAGNPASPVAQRELKWRLKLVDSVTGLAIFREVPTADISDVDLLVAGSDLANLSDAAWVSVKSAIDGNVKHPVSGNGVLLTEARLVGRNL